MSRIIFMILITGWATIKETSCSASPPIDSENIFLNKATLQTAEQKQSIYNKIKQDLRTFYSTYSDDEFGLGQQAKYTVVSAAINNEFEHFNFVGFYTVETRVPKEGAKAVKEGGCLAKDTPKKDAGSGKDSAPQHVQCKNFDFLNL